MPLRLLCVFWMPQTQGWASFLRVEEESEESEHLPHPHLWARVFFCITALYTSHFLQGPLSAGARPALLSGALTPCSWSYLSLSFFPSIPFSSWLVLLKVYISSSFQRTGKLVWLVFFLPLFNLLLLKIFLLRSMISMWPNQCFLFILYFTQPTQNI